MLACGLLFLVLGGVLGTCFRAFVLVPVTILSLLTVFLCRSTEGTPIVLTIFGFFALAVCLQGGYLAGLSGRETVRAAITNSRGADGRRRLSRVARRPL